MHYSWSDDSALGQLSLKLDTARDRSALEYIRSRMSNLDKIEQAGVGITDDGEVIIDSGNHTLNYFT